MGFAAALAVVLGGLALAIAVSLPYISDFWHQVVRKGRTFSC